MTPYIVSNDNGVRPALSVGVSPRETRIEYLFLAPRNISREEIEKSIGASLVTTREDIAICEAVQRGLASGSYEAGRFSTRREKGVHHFQKLVHERLSLAAEDFAYAESVVTAR